MEHKMEHAQDYTQKILIILLIVAAFLLGSLYTKVQFLEKGKGTAAAPTPQPSGTAQQAPAQPAVTISQINDTFKQSLIKFGDAGKKLTFIEISDPSCPYCHAASGKNSELNKQMGSQFMLVQDGGSYVAPVPEMEKLVQQGKASLAYVYFPGHGNGEMAMKALYCAFENGKFWQVHDLVMSNAGYTLINNTVKNDKTKSGDLADFLKPAMDAKVLKSCLDSGKYDSRLQTDQGLARNLGVSGTPGFFVNTTAFAGAYSYKDMESAVTAAL